MNYSDIDIWIIDFGSQYTQLITRKTRELEFKSIILTIEKAFEQFEKGIRPKALVLSGGPQSVFEDINDYSPFFESDIPVLGICYGMQIIGKNFGGIVERGHLGEYGQAKVSFTTKEDFGLDKKDFSVWMSHSDHLKNIPEGFEKILESTDKVIAGIKSKTKPIVALQFHPEVKHTDHGDDVLKYFYKDIARLEQNWKSETMLEESLELVKPIKGEKVLCAFSGGVDSLVAAVLTEKIIGKDLHCFFVDHGLLRPQDIHHIHILQKETNLNIEILDCKQFFLSQLEGLSDPEEKRKKIGNLFIEVFEQKLNEYQKNHNIHFTYLLQGTLYPDVIESTSPHGKDGKSVTIKSHHNVGGLPERMKLKLLEPFRYLLKDEVSQIRSELT